jgi:hypothetical protein
MPTAFIVTACTFGRRRTHAAQDRQQGQHGHPALQRSPRDDGDPGRGEDGADGRHEPEAFEALRHREQQGREGDEGQDGLAEPGVDVDQRVVREREGDPEVEDAEEDRPGERSAARELQSADGHHGQQEQRGGTEPQGRAPQRVEFTIAEADADRVPAREDRGGQERGGRHAVRGTLHRPTVAAPLLCPVWDTPPPDRTHHPDQTHRSVRGTQGRSGGAVSAGRRPSRRML